MVFSIYNAIIRVDKIIIHSGGFVDNNCNCNSKIYKVSRCRYFGFIIDSNLG